MDFIETLNTAASSGSAFAVAVITAAEGGTPRRPGAKMIIYENGALAGTIGGGSIEQAVIEDAFWCLRDRKTLLKNYPVHQPDGSISGSETIYIEPIFPRAQLVLCGAGHVAGHLIPLAKSIGFQVIVIDIRDEAKVRERSAGADRFILAESFADGLAQVPENENSYLIACAFNFEQDEAILRCLVERKCAYIGMLAGRNKIQTIYNHLRQSGISEETLSRIHAPIGLNIGAETPEEIALSIAAELLKERSYKEKQTPTQERE